MTTTPPATPGGNAKAVPASPESEPTSTPPFPHKPAVVHRCGRDFFRSLSRRRVLATESVSDAGEEDATHVVRLKMQARLLVNVLLIMRKRLVMFQVNESATKEDVAHCRMLLKDVQQRWGSQGGSGEFAACLKPVDVQMQSVCSKLYHECMGTEVDVHAWVIATTMHTQQQVRHSSTDLLAQLELSSVEMAPEVKELHDVLIDLKRECQVLQGGMHIRVVDVLALHHRISNTHQEMAAALIISPSTHGGNIAGGIAPATPPAVLDNARSDPPPPPLPSVARGQPTGGAPPRRVPRGHTVCADLLHDCYVVLEELWSRAHELPPPARDLLSRLVHLQTTLVGFRQEADHTEPELQVIEEGLDALNHSFIQQHETLPPHVHEVASLLIQQCSSMLQGLERCAIPMTNSMQDVHNLLSRTVSRLLEIKAAEQQIKEKEGTLAAAASVPLNEVSILKGQLARLESQRLENDGLFAGPGEQGVAGALPAGQTLCASLMHRCYDTIASLETAVGEEGFEEDGVGNERDKENGNAQGGGA